MCQPRGDERKFRVAAKATKKSATKAGVTLDAEFVSAQLVSALMKEEDEEKKEAVTEMVVHGAADKWRKLKKVKSLLDKSLKFGIVHVTVFEPLKSNFGLICFVTAVICCFKFQVDSREKGFEIITVNAF